MKKEIIFALYSIKKNIISSAELRVSFLLNIVGMVINNMSFVIIWGFLINTVGNIGGWDFASVLGLQGFTAIAFGVLFGFCFGIVNMPKLIQNGSFDQFLLSPKNVLVRVATSSFNPSALGDIVFGIMCFITYGYIAQITLLQSVLLIVLSFFAVLVFSGIMIITHSLSFYFSESDSVVRGIFDFFFTPALFHGGAFQGKLRFFFTFIVPSLVVGTLPIEAVVGLSTKTMLLAVVISSFWFLLSIWFFNRSVKRYESANFITFN